MFASGVVVDETSSVSFDTVRAGPCPNGHTGIILDGTYSALGGLYTFFKTPEATPIIQHIGRISRSVADKETSAQKGLEDVADLLPRDLGAAVKKLGSHNPITAFLIILAIISSMSLIGSNLTSIYKALSPSAPVTPTIIINNNPTNINSVTAGDRGNQAVPKSFSREQARRLKQMRAQQEKRTKAAHKDAKIECSPVSNPAHH